MKRFFRKYFEVIIWGGALVLLYFMNPSENGTSLCILKNLGMKWCPGCGLGHSIHHALHLDFKESIEDHILGIPATLILIYQAIKPFDLNNKTFNYGSA